MLGFRDFRKDRRKEGHKFLPDLKKWDNSYLKNSQNIVGIGRRKRSEKQNEEMLGKYLYPVNNNNNKRNL
jgi:hypothetical protein